MIVNYYKESNRCWKLLSTECGEALTVWECTASKWTLVGNNSTYICWCAKKIHKKLINNNIPLDNNIWLRRFNDNNHKSKIKERAWSFYYRLHVGTYATRIKTSSRAKRLSDPLLGCSHFLLWFIWVTKLDLLFFLSPTHYCPENGICWLYSWDNSISTLSLHGSISLSGIDCHLSML